MTFVMLHAAFSFMYPFVSILNAVYCSNWYTYQNNAATSVARFVGKVCGTLLVNFGSYALRVEWKA